LLFVFNYYYYYYYFLIIFLVLNNALFGCWENGGLREESSFRVTYYFLFVLFNKKNEKLNSAKQKNCRKCWRRKEFKRAMCFSYFPFYFWVNNSN